MDILAWLERHVEMHAKRRETLALCAQAALQVRALGALGRSLPGRTWAKYSIKWVWRFLRNPALEVEAVSGALLRQMALAQGPLAVLVDWTDLHPHTQLVFALPRDGRALGFLSQTIAHDGGEGSRAKAEEQALERLARLVACHGREANESWLLVTNLHNALPIHIVRLYQRACG